jgi:hypothetical protein
VPALDTFSYEVNAESVWSQVPDNSLSFLTTFYVSITV